MPPPILYINGFPGVGKSTIARLLVDKMIKYIPKLTGDHLLANPDGVVLPRSLHDYQALRRAIEGAVCDSHWPHETQGTVYVFTDFQTDSEFGRSVAEGCDSMARSRGCRLVPIILNCSKEENLRRLQSEGRNRPGKLTNPEAVSHIRDIADVYTFPSHPLRMELDVTTLSADDAVGAIYDHTLQLGRWE